MLWPCVGLLSFEAYSAVGVYLDHLVDGIVAGHADAVLAASIFHYGDYTVQQAKQRMHDAGIEVRLPGAEEA